MAKRIHSIAISYLSGRALEVKKDDGRLRNSTVVSRVELIVAVVRKFVVFVLF